MPGGQPGIDEDFRSYIDLEGPSIRRNAAVRYNNAAMTEMAMLETFESALQARADAMADACTRCGKCVEVCPITVAAGLSDDERNNPVAVIGGVIDILRG